MSPIASIGLNRAYVLTEMNRFDEAVQSFETHEGTLRTAWLDALGAPSRTAAFRKCISGAAITPTALRILEQVRRKHEEFGDARRVGCATWIALKSIWS